MARWSIDSSLFMNQSECMENSNLLVCTYAYKEGNSIVESDKNNIITKESQSKQQTKINKYHDDNVIDCVKHIGGGLIATKSCFCKEIILWDGQKKVTHSEHINEVATD